MLRRINTSRTDTPVRPGDSHSMINLKDLAGNRWKVTIGPDVIDPEMYPWRYQIVGRRGYLYLNGWTRPKQPVTTIGIHANTKQTVRALLEMGKTQQRYVKFREDVRNSFCHDVFLEIRLPERRQGESV